MNPGDNVSTRSRKDTRREFRLSARDDELLVEAAGLLGLSVSEFIVTHAVADAEAIVRDHHLIELSGDSFDRFMAALDAPRAPNPAWANALRKSRSLESVD
jgi:uncharacterized protein (DUF1778 family)